MKTHMNCSTIAVKTLGLVLLPGLIFLSTCKKDKLIETINPAPTGNNNNNNPPVEDSVSTYQSLQEFFTQNDAPAQLFTINPALYNMVTGSKGGKIIIPANSLVDSLGNYPSGNVNIQYREIYSVKDMILSDKPTTSFGNILVSGGEFFLKITASGGALDIIPGQYLEIIIPTDTFISGMQVFGEMADTFGNLNWVQQDSITAFVTNDPWDDYAVYISDLNYNWINCDYFWYNPNPKTTVTLNFASNPSETLDMSAYLVFTDINSVYGLYPYLSTSAQAYNIPETTTPTAVAIGVGVTSKKLYFAKTSFAVTTNFTTTMTLTPVTTEELKAALDSL
ncbi:MAG: hypothetical protein HYY40_07205 [Bacteroidetes bacterium]|nr:hypothetical protein [Bacteroidota bacterium]